MSNGNVKFHDNHPGSNDMAKDVISGLSESPRTIPPKYFYDENGSELFDQITKTQDYYPTRTEVHIFQACKNEIVNNLPGSCILIEPGGGSHSKVYNFIKELRPKIYVPIDISKEYLRLSSTELSNKLPWLEIHAVCDDFTKTLKVPEGIPEKSRVVFFPGSSIGNFHPHEVLRYLSNISTVVGEQGQLLIGVDLKKNKAILERAYDDSDGVTAKFNLNLLHRLNVALSANFDLEAWQHYAFYNSDQGRIEMHLKSLYKQVVNIQDHEFYFDEGETIHTENSYKYSVDEFIALSKQAGFESQYVWLDEDKLFSVHLLKVHSI